MGCSIDCKCEMCGKEFKRYSANIRKRTFCSVECSIAHRVGVEQSEMTKEMRSLSRRKKIEWVVNSEGCHVCTSHAIGKNGYPRVMNLRSDGKYTNGMNLHRFMWEQKYGVLGKGVVVRHDCDNKLCINVSHLRTGSVKDNAVDAMKRNLVAFGERHGMSKLKKFQVEEILKSTLTTSQLAKRFEVNYYTIWRIRRGENWRRVKGEV